MSGVESCKIHISYLTAFSTIAWDDLEDCAPAGRETDSLCAQVSKKNTRPYLKEEITDTACIFSM